MDESRLLVTTTPMRSASISSTISRAETFHSFFTAPAGHDDDEGLLAQSDIENMASSRRDRTDSGFGSIGGGNTASESDGDTKTITPPRPKHKHSRKTEKKRPIPDRAQTTNDIPRPSTSPHSSGKHSPLPRHRLQQRDSHPSYPRHPSRHSSRRSSFAPSQTHTRPHQLSRHSTQTDPYIAHQRAMSISRALSSDDTTALPILPIPHSTLRNSISAATLPLNHPSDPYVDPHLDPPRVAEEPKLSLHHRPTTIDWTDPSSRRRAYAKHDAKRRGVEGLWRRVRKLWPGRLDEEVRFWKGEGESDRGSVRRYRLDLGVEDEKGDGGRGCGQERGWRASWRRASCFAAGRGTGEGVGC